MKKLICLSLVLVMLAAMLVACNNNPSDTSSSPDTASSQAPSESSSANTSSEVVDDGEKLNLPDKKWNTTLVMEVQASESEPTSYRYFEFFCDEYQEDVVNIATYERSRWLEDTYGIYIDMRYSSSDVVTDMIAAIDSDIQLDIVSAAAVYLAEVSSNGYFYDFNELNSRFNDGKGWINMEASWWDQTAIRDISVADKTFFLTGDICVSDDDSTWAMFFNRDLANEYGYESPYTMVDNNTWTLDNMYEMAKGVTHANGEKLSYEPEDGDRWGLLVQSYDALMFMLGCQQTMVKKDTNDLPYLNVADEHNINVFQKMMGIMLDEQVVGVADFYGAWNSGVYEKEAKIFCNGNALFMPAKVGSVNNPLFRDSNIKYGLLPMPKYNEEQENYSSSATVYWLTVVAIPLSNGENLEATLVALEALAYYGKQHVTPAFYEGVLKSQRFQDTKSEAMLDLIFRNRTYDLGIIYNWNNMIQFYSNRLGSKSTDIISYYDQVREATQKDMDDTIDAFKAMG